MAHLHNGRGLNRQSRSRRPHGSYQFPIERRAVIAAGMAETNGWPTKQTAGLLCVCRTYVDLVRRLDKDERLKLVRGELKLAQLYKEHLQRQAERRAERLAECEAQARPELKPAPDAPKPPTTMADVVAWWLTASETEHAAVVGSIGVLSPWHAIEKNLG